MTMQEEHREWLERMFPDQKPMLPALAMAEEAGELLHAVLKLEQAQVWGTEPRYSGKDWRAAAEDAIGDCAISCCSLCNANSWDFAMLEERAQVRTRVDGTAVNLVVQLIAAASHQLQCVDDYGRTVRYLATLMDCAARLQLQYTTCVANTWSVVKQRSRAPVQKPRVVCLIGSTRFREEYQRAFYEEEHAGRICLTVPCYKDDSCCKTEAAGKQLDSLHRAKIDTADEVRLVHPEYIGNSTAAELEYIRSIGKRVRHGFEA